jgi:hypothetical protein
LMEEETIIEVEGKTSKKITIPVIINWYFMELPLLIIY